MNKLDEFLKYIYPRKRKVIKYAAVQGTNVVCICFKAGGSCLLGKSTKYERQRGTVACINGKDYNSNDTVTRCNCTDRDYEW